MTAARFLAAAFLAAGAGPAWAAETYWQHDPATPGDWFDAANWTAGVPTPDSDAYIDNGGTATIPWGTARANFLYVGFASGGHAVQTGGTIIPSYLWVGQTATGAAGTYELSGGTLSVSTDGRIDDGRVTQRGGSALFPRQHSELIIGADGAYQLIDGYLDVVHLYNTGRFEQSSGTADIFDLRGDGTYVLAGGELITVTPTFLGYAGGEARFVQSGGTYLGESYFRLGFRAGVGRYDISGGVLDIGDLLIMGDMDSGGTLGIVTQTGGTVRTHGARLERGALYLLADGDLDCRGQMKVGDMFGLGRFEQDAGTVTVLYRMYLDGTYQQRGGSLTVEGVIYIGNEFRPATYSISGGNACATGLKLGWSGEGVLEILSPAAELALSGTVCLGRRARLSAAAGAAIHMTGGALANESTDPLALDGLGNLTLIFEGGSGQWVTFEVAGADLGFVPEGFVHNFVLGELTVGGAQPAELRLEDLFDNGNRLSPEALYVHNLTVEAGSTLDLNGLHLYYDGTFINRGTVVGGTPIPEPAAVFVLALGGAGLIRRRRRRAFS